MEESHSVAERLTKQALIAAIDKEYPSPNDRARKVYANIMPIITEKEFSEWDLLCFAVEWIGWISQSFPFIAVDAKNLNSLLYTAHYYDRESDPAKRSQSATKISELVSRRNEETANDRLDVEDSTLK